MAFTFRKQICLPQDAVLTPEELGQQAAAAVKGATTAALSAATLRREQQAAAAARDQQFPSLAAVAAALPSPPLQPPARPLPRPVAVAAPAQPPHQAAFSNEDETQVQQPAGTAASTQAGRHGHARTAAVPIAAATANQGGGGAEELSSSARSAGGLLGSSPADGGGGKGGGGDFFFFFQAAGKQIWATLSCFLVSPECAVLCALTHLSLPPSLSNDLQTASGSSSVPSTSACCWLDTAPTLPAQPPSQPR